MQAKSLARLVSCDRHGYSISFNEYLRLVSIQRKEEPDGDRLLEAFQSVFFSYQLLFGSCFLVRSFDPTSSGVISEEHFRKIMRSKESVDEEDINEMIRGRENLSQGKVFLLLPTHLICIPHGERYISICKVPLPP